jgi:molecular chaperone DnaJ
MKKDFYEILGISKQSSKDEIKKAFHKLAHKFHPDKKGGDEARFKEVNEAYQVLSDDSKRAQYDQFGSYQPGGQPGAGPAGAGFGGFDFSQGGFDFNGFSQGGFGDINDIFSEFFGGGGRAQARRGRDISTEIQISFEESIFGVERNILINKTSSCVTCHGTGGKPGTKNIKCARCNGAGKIHETQRSFLGAFSTVKVCEDCAGSGQVPEEKCQTCRGAGVLKKEEPIKVVIPAGINNGEMIRLAGMGEAIPKGPAGDLYIKINVPHHPVFKREDSNLVMNLDIKLSEALLGTEHKIKTLDGDITVKIPEGVSIGEILRVKGRGVPHGRNRGDLMIKLNIKLPSKLSRHAREIIEKLKGEGI